MRRGDKSNAAAGASTGEERGKRTGRQVSVDWLEASVKDTDTLPVFDLLVKHLGKHFGREGCDILRDDARRFDARGALNMRVQADRVGQADRHGEVRPWVSVRLPGELCRAVGTDKVLDFVDALHALGSLKVSRLDVALDDFDKKFSPRQFASACVAGQLDDESALFGPGVVTRVQPDNWEWSRRKGGCFWLGGRSSERLLRVYDKDKESNGRIPAIRVELQSRNDFGTALASKLLEARAGGRGIEGVFLGHLVGFVDLRQPQGARSESSSWPRVSWWADLVGDAAAVTTAARGDSEVWAWFSQMVRQFSGFLTVVLRASGLDPRGYATAEVDGRASRKLVSAVRRILGSELRPLTAEHEVRLEQLQREFARRAGLGRGVVRDR